MPRRRTKADAVWAHVVPPDSHGVILGIDPGKLGGWGIVDLYGQAVASGKPDELNRISAHRKHILLAAVERIQFRHDDQGIKAFGISKLRENFGYWQGVCRAWGIGEDSIIRVLPLDWKRNFGLVLRRGRSLLTESQLRRLKAQMVVALAQRLWPLGDLTHDGPAAGMLLAEYVRTRFVRMPIEGFHGEKRDIKVFRTASATGEKGDR